MERTRATLGCACNGEMAGRHWIVIHLLQLGGELGLVVQWSKQPEPSDIGLPENWYRVGTAIAGSLEDGEFSEGFVEIARSVEELCARNKTDI